MYSLDFYKEFLTNLPESEFTRDYIHITNNNYIRYTSLNEKLNKHLKNHVVNTETKKHYYKFTHTDPLIIKTQIKTILKDQRDAFAHLLLTIELQKVV
jgi:hypothetical protein